MTPIEYDAFLPADDGEADLITRILVETRLIALVGASPKPYRPSHQVMAYLQAKGYRVVPVNPLHAGEVIHGETCVAALADIRESIDMVDVFRASEAVPGIVEEAISVGARTLWMQLGVRNEVAAARAQAAGLRVVMDKCPKIEIARRGL